MITGKNIAPKAKIITAGFQSQTRTNSVISIPKITSTETTGSIPPLEVTGTLLLAISALISDVIIPLPLQFPTKTNTSFSDVQNDPKTSEKTPSQFF